MKDDLVESATKSTPTTNMLIVHCTPVISLYKHAITKRQRIGSMEFGTGEQNEGNCRHRMSTRLLHYKHNQLKVSASQSPITTLTREGADDIHRTY
ncbi:MAG: hypothetical protein ACYDA9_02895 [Terriglobia bacterium]